jgi:hypothetical protein
MALKKGQTEKGSNRIRFIMLEADIADGNLSELTQAITNALKPHAALRQLSQISAPRPALPPEEIGTGEGEEAIELRETNGVEELKTPSASKSKYKPPLPKYVHDMDVEGQGNPFKAYAEERAPKSHLRRYLVAAMWLKQHGGRETLGIDHVYTCYKTVGWPLGISDWDGNFRQLVKRDLMRRVQQGEYAITPIGEGDLQDSKE